jgi:hypothetical protein
MDRRLEELQIIRDKKRKEFEIADENFINHRVLLINTVLNTNYKYEDFDIFLFYKKCIHSPIDLCVYLENDKTCLFCGENE